MELNFVFKASNLIINRYSIFNLINSEVLRVAKIRNQKIKIADFGSGSANYWIENETLFKSLKSNVSELHLFDATNQVSAIDEIEEIKVSRINGIIPEVLNSIEDDAYDLVIALDLIEHLSKEAGYLFLYELDRVSKESSVIFTPNGFVWQPPDGENKFNSHLSGWNPREFRNLGWKEVYGFTGWKSHFGSYGIPLQKKNLKNHLIYLLSLFIIYKRPNLAFAFAAVKNLKNPRN